MPAAGPAVAGARGPRILALIAEFTHTVELVTLVELVTDGYEKILLLL